MLDVGILGIACAGRFGIRALRAGGAVLGLALAACSGDALVLDGGAGDARAIDAAVVDAPVADALVADALVDALGDARVSEGEVWRGDRVFDVSVDGLVPAAIALFQGGRTAMTCDRGRTWHLGDFSGMPATDHSAYAAAPGISGGHGAFYMSLGWGEPGHALRTTDGVHWVELGEANFSWLDPGVASNWSPGRNFFGGDGFRMFFNDWLLRSPDAELWNQTPVHLDDVTYTRGLRYVRGADVLMVLGEGGTPRTFFVVMGDRDGSRFEVVRPQERGCPVFAGGPMAYWNGHVLVGGSGTNSACVSDDGGATFEPVGLPGFFNTMTDGAFVYVSHVDSGYAGLLSRSVDGRAFEELLNVGHQGNAIREMTYAPGVGYVGVASGDPTVTRTQFWRSDDGVEWVPSDTTLVVEGSPHAIDTGFVTPSEVCPLVGP